MRAIDADAVPQEFWEYEFDGKWRGCTIKDLLDSQPTIQPEPHWIPVTERLPIEYDNPIEFLCTLEDDDGNRYVDLILWTGCDWENNYTDDNEQNKYGIDKVVGWMLSPIPMRKGKVTE